MNNPICMLCEGEIDDNGAIGELGSMSISLCSACLLIVKEEVKGDQL
jgi:hypothetical protein